MNAKVIEMWFASVVGSEYQIASGPAFILVLLFATAIGVYFLSLVHISGSGKRIPSLWFVDVALYGIVTGKILNLAELHRRYGDIIRVRFLGRPATLIAGPVLLKNLLNADHSILQNDLPSAMIQLLGPGNMATMHGKEHSQRRKLFAPIFAPKNVAAMGPTVGVLAQEIVASWANEKGGEIKAYTEVRKLIMKTSAQLFLGVGSRRISPGTGEILSDLYATVWKAFFSPPWNFPGSTFQKGLKARDDAFKIIAESFWESQKLRNAQISENESNSATANCGSYQTAIDVFMDSRDEHGNPLSMEQVQSLVTSLFFGALDTTATTLLLAIRWLALRPDVMDRLRKEQEDIVAKYGEDFTEEAISAMKYTLAVAKETIRTNSPVKFLFRKAVQDIDIGGYHIPAGERVCLNVVERITHDERWMEDNPTSFQPERWLREEGSRVGGFMPFGGGPRLCLGQSLSYLELRIVLAIIARHYDVQLLDLNEKWKSFPLMTPENGMPLRIKKRA